jgi:hypothetical protein
MQDMEDYLKEKGFTVIRNHETFDGKSRYKFHIVFGGHSITRYFPYPENVPEHEKNLRQEDFLDELIKEFIQSFVAMYNRIPELNGCEFRQIGARCWGKTMHIKQTLNRLYGNPLAIKNVIFNDPATIVIWTDGTKTVVKAQDGDVFDPEKGLALAITKKALGNKGNYCNELKKWLEKYEEKTENVESMPESKFPDLTSGLKSAAKAMEHLGITVRQMNKRNNIQKAYDIMLKGRENNGIPNSLLNEAIVYLAKALED